MRLLGIVGPIYKAHILLFAFNCKICKEWQGAFMKSQNIWVLNSLMLAKNLLKAEASQQEECAHFHVTIIWGQSVSEKQVSLTGKGPK